MSSRTSVFRLVVLTSLSVMILACSRDYEVNQTADFPDEVEFNCPAIADTDVTFIENILLRNVAIFQSEQVSQGFIQSVTEYSASVGYPTDRVQLLVEIPDDVPNLENVPSVSIAVNNKALNREEWSDDLPLNVGLNSLEVRLRATVKTLPYSDECLVAEANGQVELAELVNIEVGYTINVERKAINDFELVDLHAAVSPDASDRFGASLALLSNTIVISAPNEDSSTAGLQAFSDYDGSDNTVSDSGAVYIFTREESWTPEYVLKAPLVGANDRFGFALALSEDWLAVSAPGDDSFHSGVMSASDPNLQLSNNTATNSGAVYVYRRLGQDWKLHSVVKKPENDLGVDGYDDEFGRRLQLVDDDLFVAAPGEDGATQSALSDNSQDDSGAVFHFQYDVQDDRWRFASRVKADYARAGDRFGSSLSRYGDFLLVGAPGEDSSFRGISTVPVDIDGIDPNQLSPREDALRPNSGAAYLYRVSAISVGFVAAIKSSNSDTGDGFGSAVSLADEFFIIGAPFEDGNGQAMNRNMADNSRSDSGAAYVYQSNNANWVETAYIKSFESSMGDNFGAQVVAYDTDAIIAATRQDNTYQNNGATYYYELIDDAWSDRAFVQYGQSDNARFGSSMLLSGNLILLGSGRFSDSSTGSVKTESGAVSLLEY